jgi:hypothetical protein
MKIMTTKKFDWISFEPFNALQAIQKAKALNIPVVMKGSGAKEAYIIYLPSGANHNIDGTENVRQFIADWQKRQQSA